MSNSPRPDHHANSSGTAFQNPWVQSQGLLASGQVFTKFPLEWAKTLHDHPAKRCKLVKPDFGVHSPNEGVVKATWLGHAGFMVQLPSNPITAREPIRILFDPIWSIALPPVKWRDRSDVFSHPAHLRFKLWLQILHKEFTVATLQELPEFHFVVTSHNHYDHLDWPTIEKISKLRGSQVQYIVPLGNKPWFLSGGIPAEQITEMDWSDEVELERRPSSSQPEDLSESSPEVRFICTPAQHGSGRGFHDQRSTLWASWVVKSINNSDSPVSVYHAGDTGYMTEAGPCPAFKEIGDKYGPFDLSMLPIWRGGSLSFVASMGLRLASTDLTDGLHASPAHAVALHKDIRSRHSLGMHFATFAGSDIEAFEPITELVDAKKKEKVDDWDEEWGFGTIDVGATAILPISDQAKSQLVPLVSPVPS